MVRFYYLFRAHDFFYFVDRVFFSIISCARLFYFVDRFFFLFYYLMHTTFLNFVYHLFLSFISCARLFYFVYRFFSFILSRAHFFYFVCRFFFSFLPSLPQDFISYVIFFLLSRANHLLIYFLCKVRLLICKVDYRKKVVIIDKR